MRVSITSSSPHANMLSFYQVVSIDFSLLLLCVDSNSTLQAQKLTVEQDVQS